MKLLHRYIAITIIKASSLIMLIIAGLLFLLTMLDVAKNIGDGDFGLLQAFSFVLMRMPILVYQFSPILMLIGSIVGLSMLYTHREIIVMRASGFSVMQIIKSVLITAFILVTLLAIIGEVMGPPLSNIAEMQKENAQNAGQAVVTNRGIWFHIDNNFIHVQRVVNKQLLKGVTAYQFDGQHHLQASYFAKTLTYKHGAWQMYDVVKTTLHKEHTSSSAHEQMLWDVKLNPNLFNVGLVDAEEMSLPKLATFARYLQHNGLQARQYQYVFWQRIFQPFASLIMIMLAVPFVLGALSTSTMGWRIIIGLMTGFAFFILDAFLGQVCIVYQIPAFLAAAIAPIIFAIVSIYLTKKLVRN